MSAEGWPEPQGPVEFTARAVAAALGAQILPQPVAECVGGPDDGKLIRNRDGLYETPGPSPTFQPYDADKVPPMVQVRRYTYVPESARPFYDSEVVRRFKLSQ